MRRLASMTRHSVAGLLALGLLACSPMTDKVEPPTLAPFPSPTNTPQPTATRPPTSTPLPSATPLPPTATRPPGTATTPPTATPIGIAPVSKYLAPIGGQATAQGGIFTMRRAEFWQELTLVKPKSALFIILVGELAGVGGQATCATAEEFALSMDGRRFSTNSTLMDPFKKLYRVDYPGSFRGLCVGRAEPTFVVFDTPVPTGGAQLRFRSATVDLGDLAGALRRSGYPVGQ